MADITMLNEARSAYHSLMTGTLRVKLTHKDGRSVEYQASNAKQLKSYIEQLEAELNLVVNKRRPIGVY